MKSSRPSSPSTGRAGIDLLDDVARQRRRLGHAAQRLDAGEQRVAVLLGGEIVRMDRRRLPRIGRLDADVAAALRPQQRRGDGEAGE